MKQSSFHNITGDKKLSIIGKFVYLFNILIEILILNNFPIRKMLYVPKVGIKRIKQFNGVNNLNDISPQRIAADALIIELTQNYEFSFMLDLGCGSGLYKNNFNNLGRTFDYLGIDIKEQRNNNEIIKYDLGPSFPNVEDIRNKVDFVFSHSALEHIKYDLEVLEWSIEKFPKARHLHIIPAPLSAICYNLHGFRRYSNYTLHKLSKCFTSNVKIYSIGNSSTRKLYMSYYRYKFNLSHKFQKFTGSQDYYNWLSESDPLMTLDANKHGGPEFYGLVYNF
jgi:hypothetical protein